MIKQNESIDSDDSDEDTNKKWIIRALAGSSLLLLMGLGLGIVYGVNNDPTEFWNSGQ